jgi:hypothetical protein
VRVENADAGVYFWGTQHCTVTDFEMAYDKRRATEECNCGNQNGHRCDRARRCCCFSDSVVASAAAAAAAAR